MTTAREVLLVGGGPMGRAYAAVLSQLNASFEAITRSAESAASFSRETAVRCHSGGIQTLRTKFDHLPKYAIVAVSVDQLATTVAALLELGIQRILVEKPGGVTPEEVDHIAVKAKSAKADVYVAYNRRFYESVRQTRRIIEEDGGLVSFTFEFTELSDRVGQLRHPADVMANWALANSTHVIDTVFFIAGAPALISGIRDGGFPWHPSGARYAGHGITTSGIPFTYFADWDAPGRWGIEFNTRKRKLVLRPMETLQVQERGSFTLIEQKLNDQLDKTYKAGIFRQTNAFLNEIDKEYLIDIARQGANLRCFRDHILLAPKIDIESLNNAPLCAGW